MSINSKILGLLVLAVIFGGVAAFSTLGLWQTERGGQGQRNHGAETQETIHTTASLRGTVNGYDLEGLAVTLEDGSSLYVKLGNARYNQSIGFAPQAGERVVLLGFAGEDGLFNAMTVTLEGSGQVYVFRLESGEPLWSGGGHVNGISQ